MADQTASEDASEAELPVPPPVGTEFVTTSTLIRYRVLAHTAYYPGGPIRRVTVMRVGGIAPLHAVIWQPHWRVVGTSDDPCGW